MNDWCKAADRVGGGGNWILPGKSGETSLRRWYRSWDENMLCLVTQSCPTLANPRTVARQASLSMGFSRQEYWCGLPCPPPGDLPNPGIKPGLLHCRQILYHQSDQGSPRILEWVAYPFSRWVFPTQESNQCLLLCRRILYQLSYQGDANRDGILTEPKVWKGYRGRVKSASKCPEVTPGLCWRTNQL